MVHAFIFLNSEIGMEEKVLREIKEIKEVKKANIVYGAYDIIIDISVNNLSELKSIILEKVRKLDMVISTNTMVIIDKEDTKIILSNQIIKHATYLQEERICNLCMERPNNLFSKEVNSKLIECDFSDFSFDVIDKIDKISSLEKDRDNLNNIIDILGIPRSHSTPLTEVGIMNGMTTLHSQFLALLRYSDKKKLTKERIFLKNGIINLAKKISSETYKKKINICPEDFIFVVIIKQWNIYAIEVRQLFQENPYQPFTLEPFNRLQAAVQWYFTETDEFLDLLYKHTLPYILGSSSFSKQLKKDFFSFIVYYLKRKIDAYYPFYNSPESIEMFGTKALQRIIEIFQRDKIAKVLDLFANSGIIGVFTVFFPNITIQINDIKYGNKDSIMIGFLKNINKMLKDCIERHQDSTNVIKKCIEELHKTDEYKNLLAEYISSVYTSDKYLYPIDSYAVNPNDILFILSIGNDNFTEIQKRINFSSIPISSNTKSEEFKNAPYNLIIIDPPFGNASRKDFSSDEGKDLLNASILLAEKIIATTGKLVIRFPCEWDPIQYNKRIWSPSKNGEHNLNKYTKMLIIQKS